MCLRLYSFFTIQIRCHSFQDFLCCSHHFMLCSHVTLWVYVIVFHAQSLNHVWLFVTPWTVAHQAPLSMEFSRQAYWSGLPFPTPGDLPNPGTEPRSPTLRTDSLPSDAPGGLIYSFRGSCRKWGASHMSQWVKNPPAKQETVFDPWVGKIPWRRKWQPTPICLPGKSHGQGSLVGYSPWDYKSWTRLSD